MNKLPQGFNQAFFGINVRLVSENDTEFIYRLRSDKVLTQHIHGFDGTIDDQREWLKKYKEREEKGSEYYFIYSIGKRPFGVNRIYNIVNNEGTTGSWICIPGTNPIFVLATSIILYDIAFDLIGFDRIFYDTRKDNSRALKVNTAIGGKLLYETDLDYYFELFSNDYHKVRELLLKKWHINLLNNNHD